MAAGHIQAPNGSQLTVAALAVSIHTTYRKKSQSLDLHMHALKHVAVVSCPVFMSQYHLPAVTTTFGVGIRLTSVRTEGRMLYLNEKHRLHVKRGLLHDWDDAQPSTTLHKNNQNGKGSLIHSTGRTTCRSTLGVLPFVLLPWCSATAAQ